MYVCALVRLRVSREVQLQQQQQLCSTGGLTLDSLDLKLGRKQDGMGGGGRSFNLEAEAQIQEPNVVVDYWVPFV